VEVRELACDEQIEEPDADGNVHDPHCRPKARNAFAEGKALPGVSLSPV
jgi:hypothetical protein